jgi:hypothetical protein
MDGGSVHDHEDAERSPRCPAWCRSTHDPTLHADEQHHHSAPRRAAVVAGHPQLQPDDDAVPGAVIARLVRRLDSEQTWVELVSEEGHEVRLVVTLESAQRLRTVLGDLLGRALG